MKDVVVLGVGVSGPGLPSWQDARAKLGGAGAYASSPNAPVRPTAMNSRDRRRASETVRLALAVGFEAAQQARLDISGLTAVFASCHGEGATTHKLMAALTEPVPFVSPTLFHNSVHNTPAGYWSITAGSRAPTTSISAGRFTFAAGLLKTAVLVSVGDAPALLVAYDAPFPDPIARVCPFPGPLGVAIVLAPSNVAGGLCRLSLSMVEGNSRPFSAVKRRELNWLCEANPIGQGLPLLEAIASNSCDPVTLAFSDNAAVMIEVGDNGSNAH